MKSLSQLLRAAGQMRPHATFERVDGAARASGALSVEQIDKRADHHAARWRDAAIPVGASTLMLGAPDPQTLAAIVGAVRAGLNVSLAGPALDAQAIQAEAEARQATVLAGPGEFAGMNLADRLFDAAAAYEEIRQVGLYCRVRSGALDLDAPVEDETAGVADLDPLAEDSDADAEAAREWIVAARVKSRDTIVSMSSLGGSTGLVFGAFAPLISGANLIWQAPFDAGALFAALSGAASAHLVSRAALAGDLAAAGLLGEANLGSLTLIAPEGVGLPDLSRTFAGARVFVLRERLGRPLHLDSVTSHKKVR